MITPGPLKPWTDFTAEDSVSETTTERDEDSQLVGVWDRTLTAEEYEAVAVQGRTYADLKADQQDEFDELAAAFHESDDEGQTVALAALLRRTAAEAEARGAEREREACAVECDDLGAELCAEAIRARGQA